jgi:hypothetical protein
MVKLSLIIGGTLNKHVLFRFEFVIYLFNGSTGGRICAVRCSEQSRQGEVGANFIM